VSEKGQGQEATLGPGTGIGIDGTPNAGGGGQQADQSGPAQAESAWEDPKVREALEDAIDRETLASDEPPDLGKPEIPELPDEPASEPEFPGGGPTDQRTDPDLEEHLRNEAEWQEQSEESERRAQKRRRRKGESTDSPTLQTPPSVTPANPLDRPPGLSDEQFEDFKKKNPSILDNTKTDKDIIDVT
jgi:hypothetical protein